MVAFAGFIMIWGYNKLNTELKETRGKSIEDNIKALN